jgi:hypothetical protein
VLGMRRCRMPIVRLGVGRVRSARPLQVLQRRRPSAWARAECASSNESRARRGLSRSRRAVAASC